MSEIVSACLSWLGNGLWLATWWQVALYTFVTTHITIAAVTIYLHRTQTHRAMDLAPIPSHFFRFWLWLGSGMVTKEWVAVHRKHHAKCETVDDPHSPQVKGIGEVIWRGAELYRKEAKDKGSLERFGHGTPDDWLERNLYSRFSWQGVGLTLILDVALFGALGLTVWAVQMLWIPFWAAGVVNGVGHFWGYRNFEVPDASRNVWPWGLLIGGEELHNNHHTYPTSAKFSVRKYEVDIGWMYINMMQTFGWAKVKKLPPELPSGDCPSVPDGKTLEALIANRHEVMSIFSRAIRHTTKRELAQLKAQGGDLSELKAVGFWLHCDDEKVPMAVRSNLMHAKAAHQVLDKMVTMRDELRRLWLDTSHSREELVVDLCAWCARAEASGITVLREFSLRLRSVRQH